MNDHARIVKRYFGRGALPRYAAFELRRATLPTGGLRYWHFVGFGWEPRPEPTLIWCTRQINRQAHAPRHLAVVVWDGMERLDEPVDVRRRAGIIRPIHLLNDVLEVLGNEEARLDFAAAHLMLGVRPADGAAEADAGTSESEDGAAEAEEPPSRWRRWLWRIWWARSR